MSCTRVSPMNQSVYPSINPTLVSASFVPNLVPATNTINLYHLYNPCFNSHNIDYRLINYCSQLPAENISNETQVKPRIYFSGNNNEAQAFLSRGGQVIVRMRGLPYDCTAQQVVSISVHNFL